MLTPSNQSTAAEIPTVGVPAAQNRVLEWIYDHQAIGWLALAAYYVLVVTTHDLVQTPALALQRNWGFEFVHYLIVGILLAVLWLIVLRIRVHIRRHPAPRRMIWTGFSLLAWSVLVHSLFMVRSIETIHYVQYLLLALALSSLTCNTLLAVLIASVCGVLDEGWQYFYLHPGQPYYDFNDVVMNTTGALQGAWFYSLFRPRQDSGGHQVRPMLWVWGATALLLLVLLSSGVFTIYRQESGGIPLHRRLPPTAEKPVVYERTEKWGNRWWRIHPYPGLGFLFLLPLTVMAFPRQTEEKPDA